MISDPASRYTSAEAAPACVVGDLAEQLAQHREQVAGEHLIDGRVDGAVEVDPKLEPQCRFMSVTKPSTCTVRLCSPARAPAARR